MEVKQIRHNHTSLHVIIEFEDNGSDVETVVFCVILVLFFPSRVFSKLVSVSSGTIACDFPTADSRDRKISLVTTPSYASK